MKTAEIRRRYIDFFVRNGHVEVPSAPLVYNDPTLLFVNAGMVPFKPYFTGAEDAPFARAVSVQKCVRTLDIDEVGKTTRHGTFFQMNGNFSFGDYFKAGAIEYAWELVTGSQADGNYGFDPDKVWVTVYLDDDEAAALWRGVGVPDERIQRRGLKDNYWHMGVPGPGGPCSEIYIDRGPAFGPAGGPIVDEDRFLEIWNLVFQTEELSAVRAKDDFDVLGPLPSKNIDTGMGLERTGRTGSICRIANRVRCSRRVTENQNFVMWMPDSISIRSKRGACCMKVSYWSSVRRITVPSSAGSTSPEPT